VSERIDVSIEHKHAPTVDGGRPHPNTCPKCDSHYRDDELEQHLNVCPHCGYHFPVHASERIRQLVDKDSFAEEAGELLEAYGVRRKPGLIRCAGAASLRVGSAIYHLEDFSPVYVVRTFWTS